MTPPRCPGSNTRVSGYRDGMKFSTCPVCGQRRTIIVTTQTSTDAHGYKVIDPVVYRDEHLRMPFHAAREDAMHDLFALLGIEEPTLQQQRHAAAFIENVTKYARSKIGY